MPRSSAGTRRASTVWLLRGFGMTARRLVPVLQANSKEGKPVSLLQTQRVGFASLVTPLARGREVPPLTHRAGGRRWPR